MKRLTAEQVSQRLSCRKIELISQYVNARSPSRFRCANCAHEWVTKAAWVINKKTGCPKCAGNAKLTNEIIDLLLKGRKIVRIEDYINNRTPISFRCIKCRYEWKTVSTNILYGRRTGCPQCAGISQLTNEEVDRRLQGRSIVRASNYINRDTPIGFKCLDCFYSWIAKPGNIIGISQTGCPKCSQGKNE